jgi:hypothetical protein
METLVSALLSFVIIVIAGDVFGSFGSRLLVRPGTRPPAWAEPLLTKWEQREGVDDVSL